MQMKSVGLWFLKWLVVPIVLVGGIGFFVIGPMIGREPPKAIEDAAVKLGAVESIDPNKPQEELSIEQNNRKKFIEPELTVRVTKFQGERVKDAQGNETGANSNADESVFKEESAAPLDGENLPDGPSEGRQ